MHCNEMSKLISKRTIAWLSRTCSRVLKFGRLPSHCLTFQSKITSQIRLQICKYFMSIGSSPWSLLKDPLHFRWLGQHLIIWETANSSVFGVSMPFKFCFSFKVLGWEWLLWFWMCFRVHSDFSVVFFKKNRMGTIDYWFLTISVPKFTNMTIIDL